MNSLHQTKPPSQKTTRLTIALLEFHVLPRLTQLLGRPMIPVFEVHCTNEPPPQRIKHSHYGSTSTEATVKSGRPDRLEAKKERKKER